MKNERLSSGASDATEPVHPALDGLCKDLWGVTAQELKAVEAAYRELYVTAPKQPAETTGELKEDSTEYKAEEE